MENLNIVYGTWYGDGEEVHGNILGVFRDVAKAEDAMIKAARESFDYYETPADSRFCDYYDVAEAGDQASDRLYRIIEEVEYRTDLCLLHYSRKETFGEKAYVVWGTEDYNYTYDYYPVKKAVFNNLPEAIAYAVEIECKILEDDRVPMNDRQVKFIPGEDDGRVFEIGDGVNLTSWLTVQRITIQ